jgi:hypothetical protein
MGAPAGGSPSDMMMPQAPGNAPAPSDAVPKAPSAQAPAAPVAPQASVPVYRTQQATYYGTGRVRWFSR